jgi:carbohydrate-selective porin OprB
MLSKTTLALVTSLALVPISAMEGANAQAYAERCEVYNSQANPGYGFGPCVTVQPNDVIIGTPGRPELRPRRMNGSPRNSRP